MEPSRLRDQWAVVLAGGDGTRLQELTRKIAGAPIPKQYCRIVGQRSMLEATLMRTQYYTPLHHTLIIINANHLDVARTQLQHVPWLNVVVQPCNRDTGPGLLLTLLALAQRDSNAIVSVFPSDHYVADDRAFVAHVTYAVDVVGHLPSKIVLLGVRPDRPEPGYGYIVPGEPLRPAAEDRTAFNVAGFYEKPSTEVAQSLVRDGGLWNSFVMIFQVGRMLELLRTSMPADFRSLSMPAADTDALSEAYRHLRPWNFSRDFLARIPQHLLVLPVNDVHWSDWGTRDAIERTLRQLTQSVPWEAQFEGDAAATL